MIDKYFQEANLLVYFLLRYIGSYLNVDSQKMSETQWVWHENLSEVWRVMIWITMLLRVVKRSKQVPWKELILTWMSTLVVCSLLHHVVLVVILFVETLLAVKIPDGSVCWYVTGKSRNGEQTLDRSKNVMRCDNLASTSSIRIWVFCWCHEIMMLVWGIVWSMCNVNVEVLQMLWPELRNLEKGFLFWVSDDHFSWWY